MRAPEWQRLWSLVRCVVSWRGRVDGAVLVLRLMFLRRVLSAPDVERRCKVAIQSLPAALLADTLLPCCPSLQATSLTVKGPVRFGPGVVIEGKVTLENPSKEVVTVANQTFKDGSHTLAPVAAPAMVAA